MSASSTQSIDAESSKSSNKKRKRSNEFSKNPTSDSTSESTNNKKRIRKYCPDKACYELDCEWKQCKYTSKLMDDYLKHIDDHLENDAEQSNSSNLKSENILKLNK